MTMFQKMAEAIWANRREFLGSWQGQAYIRDQALEYAEAGERNRVYRDVRAALEVLSQPSDLMVDAAGTAIYFDKPTVDVVRAAIQAALDETIP